MAIEFIKDYGFCPATLGGYAAEVKYDDILFRIYGITPSLKEVFFSYQKEDMEFFEKGWVLEQENKALFDKYTTFVATIIKELKLDEKSSSLFDTEEMLYAKSRDIFHNLMDSFTSDKEESFTRYKAISTKVELIIEEFRKTCVVSEENLAFLEKPTL